MLKKFILVNEKTIHFLNYLLSCFFFFLSFFSPIVEMMNVV